MKELESSGRNWRLSVSEDDVRANEQVQLTMIRFATAQLPSQGADKVLNGCLAAYMNVATFANMDPDHLRKVLHEFAEQLPDMMAAARLANSPEGNSSGRPI